MAREQLHRFEYNGKGYAIDPETCFCFECDQISWDVLAHYPETPINRILHLLRDTHSATELNEVVGELEWLRATKAILPAPSKEQLQKEFEVERGLKRLTVELPAPEETGGDGASRNEGAPSPNKGGWRAWLRSDRTSPAEPVAPSASAQAQRAVELLLSRSGAQSALHLAFVEPAAVRQPALLAECCAGAFHLARLAGKTLTASVLPRDIRVDGLPDALKGHALSVRVTLPSGDEAIRAVLERLTESRYASLNALSKLVQTLGKHDAEATVVVRPGHPGFGGVVETLHQAEFPAMELDLDGAYIANPGLDPAEMVEGLSQCAVYYAQQLLRHQYFRLDPVASLFRQIYEGLPNARSDPAGLHELAVDAHGDLYPSGRMLGWEIYRVGNVNTGEVDEEVLRPFEDAGARTTGVCRRCWIRNLCGGGRTATHHAFTGSFRTPYEPWCESQREWMAAAVSAFNLLSAQGVNFTRVYGAIGQRRKPSLFTMARAAFGMSVGMRPIEEADAERLVRWENWSETAYFLFTETGAFLATRYDREMDALHSQMIEQEFMLIRRNGDPFGLFRVRPESISGAAMAWIWMAGETDYNASSVQKGFRALLKQASSQQEIQRVAIPVLRREAPLAGFLQALDFEHAGVIREAVYLHGAYEDVDLYRGVLNG
ncbi:MAG: SPASM domain-containing protein [Candidatus Hydrogenedentota bacterium]